jgi:hypothetical protein
MVPPCDLEAEGALCAACLIAPRRAPDVLAALDPRDCYSDANRAILAAVRSLCDAGEPVDVLTVRSRLNGSVPAEYLAQLMGSAPTIEHLDAYGAIVAGKARQRRTIARLQQLAAEGYAAADADAWLAEVAAATAIARPAIRGIASGGRQAAGARGRPGHTVRWRPRVQKRGWASGAGTRIEPAGLRGSMCTHVSRLGCSCTSWHAKGSMSSVCSSS